MKIWFITGTSRGLGRQWAVAALARGDKVAATARDTATLEDLVADYGDAVLPLALDVTDPASVATAVEAAPDVSVVINNAGASNGARLDDADQQAVRDLFEINYFGAVAVANAFAPTLARNGGGALLNVLSVLSWIAVGDAYSATKAALWSATGTQRLELAGQGTLVTGLYLGYTDTPMAAHVDAPKNDPADVVAQAYDGIEQEQYEVLADDLSRQVKTGLAAPVEALYPQLAKPAVAG